MGKLVKVKKKHTEEEEIHNAFKALLMKKEQLGIELSEFELDLNE